MRAAAIRVNVRGARFRRLLLLAGILLIAFNLRPTLASVGPLVDDIRAATGLSSTALGLLTTLPLLAFAAVSALTPWVTRALGFGGALLAGLVLIGAGGVLRAVGGVTLLFAGTALLGVGIALGNVLIPALVKRDFAHRSGSLTGMYSAIMALGASLAAGVSVPLAEVIGWRGVLAAWALPTIPAILLWIPQLKASPRPRRAVGESEGPPRRLLRSSLAWQIAAFMGLQSMTFYVLLAWLPDLLQSGGMSASGAGWMLSISQATGILGSAAVPVLAGRLPDQRSSVWLMGAIEAVGLAGLSIDALSGLTWLWVGLMGIALGGTFGLALLFLVVRSPDTETTTRLSGMAQAIGYGLAAVGPVLVGLLYDLTMAWTLPLLFLAVVLIGKVVTGLLAARDAVIEPA